MAFSIINKLIQDYEERERNNPTPPVDEACLEEIRKQQEQVEEERKRLNEERRQREWIRTQPAREFNASLKVPVQWQPNYKLVLSGLTERSAGNGHYKGTVYHIQVLEDLHEGRLHRPAHSLLCTKDSGSYGVHDTQEQTEYIASSGITHKVTCQACLRIAQKWSKHTQQSSTIG